MPKQFSAPRKYIQKLLHFNGPRIYLKPTAKLGIVVHVGTAFTVMKDGTSSREKRMLQAAKLEGQSDLSSLTPDMELQGLEFALLAFSPALVQYLLSMVPFLPFVMIMYVLCHCVLEVYDLLLILIYRGLQLRDCLETLDSGLLNGVELI